MGRLIVGGVVPPGNLTYRSRDFEGAAIRLLTGGDWVTLLGPRQHGKSSALIRISDALSEEGIQVALVDLQAYLPGEDDDLKVFLKWLVVQIRQSLGAPVSLEQVDDVDNVDNALAAACAGISGSITIMLDEAGRLSNSVRYLFYSQLRAFHTASRSTEHQGLGSRLTLLFSGTFRPDTIIDDDNSPFNVSRLIVTSDLTREQAVELARSTGDDSLAAWGDRSFDLAGGMPYLIQALLDAVASTSPSQREAAFSAEVSRLLSGSDGHLPALFRRLASEPEAEDRLRAVVAAGPLGLRTSGEGATQFLEIVGAAKAVPDSDGTLRLFVRNALYERAFEASPRLNPQRIIDRAGRLAEDGGRSILAPLSFNALDWVADSSLRVFIEDLHAGGVEAANKGRNRLALAGLGAALEGLLLARIEGLDAIKLEAARTATKLNNGKSPRGDAANWTFEALSKVLIQSGELPDLPTGAAEMLRNWRNLVHPELARRLGKSESDLEPTVAIMAACVTLVLQSSPTLPSNS